MHHYEAPPYSKEIRIPMGFKGLPVSRSALIAPKADLLSLTGDFSRVPVLQIGADIYCESALIAAELDHRFPARTLSELKN
ncbi:glutathione S-transferase N-terminal domain-containing protein [Sulfitobacter sp.]|uniref:glutathione S-transferase N-terminal domain-containing protein n=1 Tax=Sulfitobacter sp. TaxID=1903071 RepID=UPI0030028240